jgi:CxxC motif-containing protein (DUF1111 family)
MGSNVSFRIGGIACMLLFSIASTSSVDTTPPGFGEPLAGLPADLLERFNDGKEEFQSVETPEEGVGPVFNDVSCATCHFTGAVGGGAPRLETRFGRLHGDGTFDPMTEFGGSLIQENGIGPNMDCNYLAEVVPPEATIVAKRRTTPLFGLGLVDAVPDATFVAIANEERFNPDHIKGTVAMVPNIETGQLSVGKFGWKGQNPSLFQFSGDAYVNEMGITSPQFVDENCPQGDCDSLHCNPRPDMNDDGTDVALFADFMKFLAAPPRGPITGSAIVGELVFRSIGCVGCHRSVLRTGPNPVAALDRKTIHPYSDFLLHDMGSLGDGITQNNATGKLMRTAPLWGLRKITTYLHDGRATTLEQAILAHDGQAKKARDRFASLSGGNKQFLYAFLNSL